MVFKVQEKVKIKWSSDFAYAVGLIASDGCLSKDGSHISFHSKEIELINKFKYALDLDNKPYRVARGGEQEKKYFVLAFGDKIFHQYLNGIGITSAKSKTIKAVDVPDNFFADFFRGLFDGDGSFYTFWDKRWPNSFGFKLSIASASIDFIKWLKQKLTDLYGVKGYTHKGDGVLNLEYVKGDSKRLFAVMYYKDNLLFFSKKYIKVKNALEKDKKLGIDALQKPRNAAVAQR
ncbi:hypothetical protein D4R86_04125 [bacterium]|nr:MAG: hypothetical protein D4R86_04125 [bacterium]